MSETNFGNKFFLNDKLHNIYIYILQTKLYKISK